MTIKSIVKAPTSRSKGFRCENGHNIDRSDLIPGVTIGIEDFTGNIGREANGQGGLLHIQVDVVTDGIYGTQEEKGSSHFRTQLPPVSIPLEGSLKVKFVDHEIFLRHSKEG